jgi:hypothetical protein
LLRFARNDDARSDQFAARRFADPYFRFCPLGAAAAAGGLAGLAGGGVASVAGTALLPPPKITRLGLRSKLFTAWLMSASVRRPAAVV